MSETSNNVIVTFVILYDDVETPECIAAILQRYNDEYTYFARFPSAMR